MARPASHRPWLRHYPEGVDPDPLLEPRTLPDFLAGSARRTPKRKAIVFEGVTITYRQLQDRVDRLATALASMGVGPDRRVAVHLPNLPQTVIGVYATLSLGAQVVMTNPLYVEREIEHQWNDAGCVVAITTDFLYARVLASMRHCLPVQHYVLASIPEIFGFPKRLVARWLLARRKPPLAASVRLGDDVHSFRQLVVRTDPAPPKADLALDDLALLQYTGGTTGVAKGAMLTHGNLSANLQQMRAWLCTLQDDGEVFLSVLPFFHVFGLSACMNLPVAIGGTMVLMPNPRDTAGMARAIQRHGVTTLAAVPTMFHGIAHHPGVERFDLSSVKACLSGSAPLPSDTRERFEHLTGATIVEGYGLTETSPLTHCNPLRGLRKAGTVGLPVPGTDARIVDPGDGVTEVEPGCEGELQVSGPQVMAGYWRREDETAQVLRNGWLATGDLAVMDEDGYFRIVGRKKELIIAGGYNIYPDEIDDVLAQHPAVSEACTIGLPHPRRGESVHSFVVLGPGGEVSAEELLAWCRERLAAYKVPSEVVFRDSLPKSTMMKLLRRKLKAAELARRTERPSA